MAPKRRSAGTRRPARSAPRAGAGERAGRRGSLPRRRRGAWGVAGRASVPSARSSGARLKRLLRRGGALGPRLARVPKLAWILVAVVLLVGINFGVQVYRKPTELLGLVLSPTPLTPEQTWTRYAPDVRAHATDVVRPELLAALIQVESAGDPYARTYWRWQWTLDPSRVYAPASSAVGLLQITDGTFEEAKRYCIHDHRVVREDGPFVDSCWLNAFYFRTVPGHAIEMTSALLHVQVSEALGPERAAAVAAARRDALAAVIHLCGRGRAAGFAANGFRPRPGERCGDHDLRGYVERVRVLTAKFERMGAGEGSGR